MSDAPVVPTAQLQVIPLAEAYLCQNCNCVVNSSSVCPSCASTTSLLGLASVLNREGKEETSADSERLPTSAAWFTEHS